MTEQELSLGLTDDEREDLKNGTILYIKHLRVLAASCVSHGKEEDGRRYIEESDGLEAELVEPFKNGGQVPYYERHRVALLKGLGFHVTHLRAQRGGLLRCGEAYEVTRAQLEIHADRVTGPLISKFDEQTGLL